MGVTDLQVLQAFKKGQLELFYRRIYPGLLLYAVKNAGDRHDFLAEDCVQNAIFNAWKRRDSFDSIYTLILRMTPSLRSCPRLSSWWTSWPI